MTIQTFLSYWIFINLPLLWCQQTDLTKIPYSHGVFPKHYIAWDQDYLQHFFFLRFPPEAPRTWKISGKLDDAKPLVDMTNHLQHGSASYGILFVLDIEFFIFSSREHITVLLWAYLVTFCSDFRFLIDNLYYFTTRRICLSYPVLEVFLVPSNDTEFKLNSFSLLSFVTFPMAGSSDCFLQMLYLLLLVLKIDFVFSKSYVPNVCMFHTLSLCLYSFALMCNLQQYWEN